MYPAARCTDTLWGPFVDQNSGEESSVGVRHANSPGGAVFPLPEKSLEPSTFQFLNSIILGSKTMINGWSDKKEGAFLLRLSSVEEVWFQMLNWRTVLITSQKAEKLLTEKQHAVRYKFPSEKGHWLFGPTGYSKNNTE